MFFVAGDCAACATAIFHHRGLVPVADSTAPPVDMEIFWRIIEHICLLAASSEWTRQDAEADAGGTWWL